MYEIKCNIFVNLSVGNEINMNMNKKMIEGRNKE